MIVGDLEYLMGSLPNLTFQDTDEVRSKVFSILRAYAAPSVSEKKPISFLDAEARKFLGPSTYRTFQQIDLTAIHTEPFQKSKNKQLAAFSKFMYALKKDIRQLRISRKNGEDPMTKKTKLPLVPGNPLQEELQLLKWQWDKLEELSIGHYTDFGALVIYKLKLSLLLRWWGFDQERGYENFLNNTKMTADGR